MLQNDNQSMNTGEAEATPLLTTFRHAGGRPSLLNDELKNKALAYIYCDAGPAEYANRGNVIPTVEDFALYLGIHRDTVYSWTKDDTEFSDIVEAIKQLQANELINKGLEGKFNSNIAKLILSGKHGYVERSEIDQNVKGEVQFINDVPRPDKN